MSIPTHAPTSLVPYGIQAPGAGSLLPGLLATPSIGLLIPSSGPTSGGNAVLILGSGLANAVSVTFGGTPATILFQDPIGLVIIVLAPAHAAGTVPVVVTTASGSSAPAMYTYLGAQPPLVFTMNPTSGPATGGTSFTIVGANLSGATVTFNGNAATSVTVDPTGTVLTGVTPAGAVGNATVTVTTASGSVTVPGGFNYTAAVPPVVTGMVPTSGSVAGGTAFVITGTNLSGTTSVTFNGNPATGIVVNGTGTAVFGLTPAGAAGNVTVTVTTPAGAANVTGGFTYTP